MTDVLNEDSNLAAQARQALESLYDSGVKVKAHEVLTIFMEEPLRANNRLAAAAEIVLTETHEGDRETLRILQEIQDTSLLIASHAGAGSIVIDGRIVYVGGFSELGAALTYSALTERDLFATRVARLEELTERLEDKKQSLDMAHGLVSLANQESSGTMSPEDQEHAMRVARASLILGEVITSTDQIVDTGNIARPRVIRITESGQSSGRE